MAMLLISTSASPSDTNQTSSTSNEESFIAVIVVTIVLTCVIIGLVVYNRRIRTREKNRLQLGVSPQFEAFEVTNKAFNSPNVSSPTSTTTTAPRSKTNVTSSSRYSDLTPNHTTYESNLTTAAASAATTTTTSTITPSTPKTGIASTMQLHELASLSLSSNDTHYEMTSPIPTDAQYEIPRIDSYVNLTTVDEQGYVA